jgi:hypothetical protein
LVEGGLMIHPHAKRQQLLRAFNALAAIVTRRSVDSSAIPLEPHAVDTTIRTATQEYEAKIAMQGKTERQLRDSRSLIRKKFKVQDGSISRVEGQVLRLRIRCKTLVNPFRPVYGGRYSPRV